MAAAKRKKKEQEETVQVPDVIYCRDCERGSQFGDNSCFCSARNRRVCACEKYGRPGMMCRDLYKPKIKVK